MGHLVLAAMYSHLNKSTSKGGKQCPRSEVMCMHSFTNTTCDIKATDADGSVYCHPRYSADTPSCIASCAVLLWVRHVGLCDEQKERLYGRLPRIPSSLEFVVVVQ